MTHITDFDNYQALAMKTSKDMGSKERQFEYAVLSLCGEVGELANLLKKQVYHNKTGIGIENYLDEASDILWYLACLADAMGVKLSDIASYNIEKLKNRYESGKYEESHYVNK